MANEKSTDPSKAEPRGPSSSPLPSDQSSVPGNGMSVAGEEDPGAALDSGRGGNSVSSSEGVGQRPDADPEDPRRADDDASGRVHDDEDPDFAFIDRANPSEMVQELPEDEDAAGEGLGDESDNIAGARPRQRPRLPGINPAPDALG